MQNACFFLIRLRESCRIRCENANPDWVKLPHIRDLSQVLALTLPASAPWLAPPPPPRPALRPPPSRVGPMHSRPASRAALSGRGLTLWGGVPVGSPRDQHPCPMNPSVGVRRGCVGRRRLLPDEKLRKPLRLPPARAWARRPILLLCGLAMLPLSLRQLAVAQGDTCASGSAVAGGCCCPPAPAASGAAAAAAVQAARRGAARCSRPSSCIPCVPLAQCPALVNTHA